MESFGYDLIEASTLLSCVKAVNQRLPVFRFLDISVNSVA